LASTQHPASASNEEDGWIARAAAGDEQAVRWLVERYQDQIHSVVLRLVRDADLAAEATQDAFVKAFRGLGGFESRSRFSTWLYRIAVNVCYDRLGRKPRPAEIALEDLAGQGVEPSAGTGWRAEDPLEEAEGRAAFEEALASLDDIYRLAFVLRQIEDRPYGEIAGVLGISETNAKVRVHRAREMMVTRLKHRGVL
jgi:RNA polymerase sigma factor (sigma-70 family)